MDPTLLVGLIVIAVALWFILRAQPAAVFVVAVKDGVAIARQGTVTDSFLKEVTEQCRNETILTGEIRGLPWGKQIRLSFGKEFPAEVQQRLRNWWSIHGWRRPLQQRAAKRG